MDMKKKTVEEMLMWLKQEGYSQRIVDAFEGVCIYAIQLNGVSFILTNQPTHLVYQPGQMCLI